MFHPFNCEQYCVERVCELASVSVCLSTKEKFLLVAIYRPHGKQYDTFFDRISELIDNLMKKHTKIIIIGDFNVDLAEDSFRITKYRAVLESYGLVNIVDSYTREVLGSKTLIDHILTNRTSIKVTIIISALSDHHAQSIFIPSSDPKSSHKDKRKYVRNFGDSYKRVLKHLLSKENWDDILMNDDPDETFEAFYGQLKYLFELAFPKRRVIIKNFKAVRFPLSKDFVKIKDELFALYKKTKDYYSSHYLRQYYQRLKSRYRKMIKQAKPDNILMKISRADNKSKTIWDIINKNKSPKKKSIDTIFLRK